VRVTVLGDSVAWRLGFALLADQPQQSYGVDIDNGAIVACGVMRSTQYVAHGVPDAMAPQCNSQSPTATQWPAQWKGNITAFHPNVVMILAGRWEVMDRQIDGHWSHIGEPAFDAELRRSLEQAVRVATGQGAYAVLMTAPCFDSGEQPDGLAWPEDSATRLALYNDMLHQIAAEHPTDVRIEDFGGMVCPGGTYTTSLDGVQLRSCPKWFRWGGSRRPGAAWPPRRRPRPPARRRPPCPPQAHSRRRAPGAPDPGTGPHPCTAGQPEPPAEGVEGGGC
jgi:hypothetical protein